MNFLDITFDLRSGTFKPYTKPGNASQHVNVQSNHLPSIVRRIPETINQRLSRISSDKQSLDASTRPYQEALKKSGYSYNLHYDPQTKVVIYQAAVTNKATKEVQTYVGLTENTFKTCHLYHTSSFRNKTKRNATILSQHIWKLKDSNSSYTINWKIIKKS